MSKLTILQRLEIIQEQLNELSKEELDADAVQETIREIRNTTWNIWDNHGWNESSMDC